MKSYVVLKYTDRSICIFLVESEMHLVKKRIFKMIFFRTSPNCQYLVTVLYTYITLKKSYINFVYEKHVLI